MMNLNLILNVNEFVQYNSMAFMYWVIILVHRVSIKHFRIVGVHLRKGCMLHFLEQKRFRICFLVKAILILKIEHGFLFLLLVLVSVLWHMLNSLLFQLNAWPAFSIFDFKRFWSNLISSIKINLLYFDSATIFTNVCYSLFLEALLI